MPVPPTQQNSAPAYVPVAALIPKSASQSLRPSYASRAKRAVEREQVASPKTTKKTSTANELAKGATMAHSASLALESVPEGRMSSFVSEISTKESTLPGSPETDAYSDEESIEIITTRTQNELPILNTRSRAPLAISPPIISILDQQRMSDQASQTASTPSLSTDSSPTSNILPLNIERDVATTGSYSPLEHCPPVLLTKVSLYGIQPSSKSPQPSMLQTDIAAGPRLHVNTTSTLDIVATPIRPNIPEISHHHNTENVARDPLACIEYNAGVRAQRPCSPPMDNPDASEDELIPFPPLPSIPFASLNDPPTTDYDIYSEVDGSQPWSLDGAFINDDPQRGLEVNACWASARTPDEEPWTGSHHGETPMFATQYPVYSTAEQMSQFVPHGMSTAFANGIAVQLQQTADGSPAAAYYIPPPPVITQLFTTTDGKTSATTSYNSTEHLAFASSAAMRQPQAHRQTQSPSASVPSLRVAQSAQAVATAVELAIAQAVGNMPPTSRPPNRHKYNKHNNNERPNRMSRYSGGYSRGGYSTPGKHEVVLNTKFDRLLDLPGHHIARNLNTPMSSQRLTPGTLVQIERRGSGTSTTFTDRRSSTDPSSSLGGGCLLGSAHLNLHKVREQRPSVALNSSSSDGVVENVTNGDRSTSINGQMLDRSLRGGVDVGNAGANSDHGCGEYTGHIGPASPGGVDRTHIGEDGSSFKS